MAGFGGTIKLEGEQAYRQALKNIATELQQVAAQQKLTAATYDKSDKSLSAIAQRSQDLTSKLDTQKQKLATITDQLKKWQAQQEQNKTTIQNLQSQLDKEKAKLEQIAKQYGTNSKQYQDQAKVVDSLEKELKELNEQYDKNEQTIKKNQAAQTSAQAAVTKTEKEIAKLAEQTGKASDETKDLGNSTEDAGRKAKNAGDGFTVFKGVLANLATDALRLAVNGLKKMGTALIETGKQAVASYADYEQLVGGVETLFKNSAKEVEGYAAVAYKTAGLSANKYMETVTSFSASLLQGLGGDTAKAAKIADMAIIDMADNANKMGTSIELIQNAYQGFAKDNFTMLDNLKLGYGGTAGEMARLINETGVMGKAFKATAQNVKDVPFDKMIEAIHKVQQNMGITGTTALEASETISGSVNSMKAAWSNLLTAIADDNADLGKSLDEFVESVKTAGKNIVPRIKQVVEGFKQLAKALVNEVFPQLKKEVPELRLLIEPLEWIINNRQLVVSALSAIVGAFAVKKVADFTSSLAGAATSIRNLIKPASQVATAMSGASSAIATVGTAGAGAASSTGALTAAFGALTGPVALATAGVLAAVTAMVASANAIKRSSTELNENMKATEKLAKEQQSFTKTIDENRKAREANLKTANKELNDTDALVYRLDILAKKTDKTTSEKKEMKAIVEKLNQLVPDLALSYNAESDSLSENTEKIQANVDARKHLNSAEAERTNLSGITEEMSEAEEKLAKAVEQNEKNEKTYLDARKKREDFEKKYTPEQIANHLALQNELIRLTNLEKMAQNNYEKSSKVVKGYGKDISNLKDEYSKTADAAEDFERRANVAVALEAIAEKARKAGREIPKQLAEGMEDGRYAVPASIAQLDKLIEFDAAIQKAGLTGKKIPESISAGLIEGKYSVAEAMRQVTEVIDLADDVEKMYNDGASLSKSLADGIRSGKVSVDEANAQIKASTDYGVLVEQALKTGVAIPTGLGEGIREGTITAQEAVQQMKDAITFSELTQKATEAGIQIPQFLAEQVTAGEVKPAEAVNRMQALIDYRKSLDDAGLAGVTIPENFVEGILSGEMNVTDSIATMNGWVQFKKALDDTDAAGKDIPKVLASDILAGKTTVDNAVTGMNNWIKFQDAIKTTKAAGQDVPDWLAKQILAGKVKPENAVKMLNQLMQMEALKAKKGGEEGGKAFDDGLNAGLTNKAKKNAITSSVDSLGLGMKSTLKSSIDAHSPSRDAATIGGYFLDGLNNGIANQNKRNSIFSSLWNFGSGLLSKLKASLQEHSPSKATEEMGVNLLKGLSNGIDDEENGVLDRVKTLGETMLGTLNGSLAEGIDANAFSGLQEAIPSDFSANIAQTTDQLAQTAQNADIGLVGQFKQALSEMKIVMDDEEMGKFVDKTVTDLVYN